MEKGLGKSDAHSFTASSQLCQVVLQEFTHGMALFCILFAQKCAHVYYSFKGKLSGLVTHCSKAVNCNLAARTLQD